MKTILLKFIPFLLFGMATSANAESTCIEGEHGGALGAAQVYSDAAASNGAGMAWLDTFNSGIQFSNVPESSSIVMRYASELSGTLSVVVNGNNVGQISFTATGAWVGAYAETSLAVSIPENSVVNLINLGGGDRAANVDYVDFVSSVELSAEKFETTLQWSDGGGSHSWEVEAGGTPSSSTGPSSAAEGSLYAYLETSSCCANTNGDNAILLSPSIAGSDRSLTFLYHMYGTNIGTLYVDVVHTGGIDYAVWSRSGQQHSSHSDPWHTATVNLAAYTGAIQIRIRAVASGGWRGDIAIDNIVVTGNDDGTPGPRVLDSISFNDNKGQARVANIYDSGHSGPRPVLFFFHGANGNMNISANRTNFHGEGRWDEAIIVYADSGDSDWDGTYPPDPNKNPAKAWSLRFPYKAALGQTRDLSYVDYIVNYLRTDSKYEIDENRIFAAGYSSGGFFTLSLMELRPDVFDGYALVGAYARYKVCTQELHDADPVLCPNVVDVSNFSSPPLPLIDGQDEAANPRPVLYMFGDTDTVFNVDAGSNGWPGYHPTNMSLSRSTLEQLIVRNHMVLPDIEEFWDTTDFWPENATGRIFTPSGGSGAVVHWKPFRGGHTWTQAGSAASDPTLPDHNQWTLDFFKSL